MTAPTAALIHLFDLHPSSHPTKAPFLPNSHPKPPPPHDAVHHIHTSPGRVHPSDRDPENHSDGLLFSGERRGLSSRIPALRRKARPGLYEFTGSYYFPQRTDAGEAAGCHSEGQHPGTTRGRSGRASFDSADRLLLLAAQSKRLAEGSFLRSESRRRTANDLEERGRHRPRSPGNLRRPRRPVRDVHHRGWRGSGRVHQPEGKRSRMGSTARGGDAVPQRLPLRPRASPPAAARRRLRRRPVVVASPRRERLADEDGDKTRGFTRSASYFDLENPLVDQPGLPPRKSCYGRSPSGKKAAHTSHMAGVESIGEVGYTISSAAAAAGRPGSGEVSEGTGVDHRQPHRSPSVPRLHLGRTPQSPPSKRTPPSPRSTEKPGVEDCSTTAWSVSAANVAEDDGGMRNVLKRVLLQHEIWGCSGME